MLVSPRHAMMLLGPGEKIRWVASRTPRIGSEGAVSPWMLESHQFNKKTSLHLIPDLPEISLVPRQLKYLTC